MDKGREEVRKDEAAAANPLTRKLNKILNGGDGGRGIGGPSEVIIYIYIYMGMSDEKRWNEIRINNQRNNTNTSPHTSPPPKKKKSDQRRCFEAHNLII